MRCYASALYQVSFGLHQCTSVPNFKTLYQNEHAIEVGRGLLCAFNDISSISSGRTPALHHALKTIDFSQIDK